MVTGTARERLARLLPAQDDSSSSIQLKTKDPVDLHLEVDGIGRITMPVAARQARQLRDLALPARFGHGERTLTDPSVRDTWEVPAERVRIEWTHGLDRELDTVRRELGLPEQCRLTAEMHSMLVYEEGQFFLPHQDSEKDDTMVATLVVTLPSARTGGALVVHHGGQATTYRGSKTLISLVAFYADRRHEIRPVTSGHRISLTYNLLLHGDPTEAPPDRMTVHALARQLREHFSTPAHRPYSDRPEGPPNRLVFLLDHEYTERGLSWTRLKGSDATRASLLRAATRLAQSEAALALADINEIWNAYDPDARSHSYRYRDQDDEASDEGIDDQDPHEIADLVDSTITLTRWTGPDGSGSEGISLAVDSTEVCAVTPSSFLQPYRSEYEGYMGNYGNTLDRWYRRAAVVVWPRELDFANRAEASPSWAMDDLRERARTGDPEGARSRAATLAPFWRSLVGSQSHPGQLLSKVLPAAAALDDAEVAATLVSPFAVEALGSRHLSSLVEAADRYGDGWTDGVLRAWFARRMPQASARPQWLATLPALCDQLQAKGTVGASTGSRLLELAWNELAGLIGSALALRSPTTRRQELDGLGKPLAALVVTAGMCHADLRATIVEYCGQDGLASCVMTALRTATAEQYEVFAPLAGGHATRLRTQLARPVRDRDDWSLELLAGCSCVLCEDLRVFLADRGRRTWEWPLAQDRRSHVHSRIDQAELPVSHLTRRQGRPFTLVLTKTGELFDREARQRIQDQADLDQLLALWP